MTPAEMAAVMSSSRHDWRTPPEALTRVKRALGGAIGLDPCASADNPCGATSWLAPGTGPEHGWTREWPAAENVFANPPYGSTLKHWVTRIVAEAASRETILLTPARTDTGWFREAFRACQVVYLWPGRLTFVDPGTGEPASRWNEGTGRWERSCAPFPSAFFYFGPYLDRFESAFDNGGVFAVCDHI